MTFSFFLNISNENYTTINVQTINLNWIALLHLQMMLQETNRIASNKA